MKTFFKPFMYLCICLFVKTSFFKDEPFIYFEDLDESFIFIYYLFLFWDLVLASRDESDFDLLYFLLVIPRSNDEFALFFEDLILTTETSFCILVLDSLSSFLSMWLGLLRHWTYRSYLIISIASFCSIV